MHLSELSRSSLSVALKSHIESLSQEISHSSALSDASEMWKQVL